MRVLLVGSSSQRARIRAEFRSVDVVGEFSTLAAARASRISADATIVAAERGASEPMEEPLTPREVQVLELMAEGLSNKAIAEQLAISDQTAKFHVASISGKLGASNRTDAVRRAVRRGLISL